MANISRREFWNLIKKEMAYYNKKWAGDDETEKKRNESEILAMYYKALSHVTEYAVEVALNRHRAEEKTFPKINQILKYIPRHSETYKPQTHESTPMPDSVAKVTDKKQKQSPELCRQMAAMVNRRWPSTSADEALALFEVEPNK